MHFAIPLIVAIATSILTAKEPARADEDTGMRQIAAHSRERGVDLAVTVWYPAERGGKAVSLGENVFFVGTQAMQDAPIRHGRYPLILLSHGAGLAGNPEALSWLATPLAKHGFIVAAPAHPGNSGPDRSAAETMKLWIRPQDITETLNAFDEENAFSGHIKTGKVGMLGLSMGGGTALAIAGARIDPRRLERYCDTDAVNQSLCEWLRQSGLDLHTMDLGQTGRDNKDARIGFAMAIDPAPVDIFDFKSFANISMPVELVNLGKPGMIAKTTQASEIAKAIPNASYSTIGDASHYSMFAQCKPGAAEIAEEEDIGDPICADGAARSRGEIHEQMIDMVVNAFDRALKQDR